VEANNCFTDIIWAVSGTTGFENLYTIDPATGVATIVGPHGITLPPGTYSGMSIGTFSFAIL
jgi:hypothetical protein